MGWTYQHKDRNVTVKDFFVNEFSHSSDRVELNVLDVAVVNLRTAYLAVEKKVTEDGQTIREVFALVCLLDYKNDDYHNFGYKDMEESMHPYYYDCPKRILDLLTPTDDEWAQAWREKCLESLWQRKNRPSLRTGSYLVLDEPVEFSGGEVRDVFYIQDARKRDFRVTKSGYTRYRLTKQALDRGYKVMTDEELSKYINDRKRRMLNEVNSD